MAWEPKLMTLRSGICWRAMAMAAREMSVPLLCMGV